MRVILRPVIARPLTLLALVFVGAHAASAASAASSAPAVEILVPGQTQPVRLAPADADAFQRRLSPPPPYVGPLPAGESFVVISDYWNVAVGTDAGGPPTDAPANYFPSGGVVRVRQFDRDAFFVLDLRQRAMLDRYIRLAKEGAIEGNPSALVVFAGAARSETIAVEVAGMLFEADGPRGFWNAIRLGDAQAIFNNPPVPPPGDGGYWLVVTAAEGRSLAYFYDTARQTLTDALGTETYDARNLAAIGVLPPPPSEQPAIAQQPTQGSQLWWPVMLGGGAALLAAAIWLRRRELAGR